MNCQDTRAELVSFIKGESDNAKLVEEHLATCELCAEECRTLRKTLTTVSENLAPIELSADFRKNLAARISDKGSKRMSTSERHLKELDKPFTTRIIEHSRRSPYFAASLALHAVAAMVLVAVFINYSSDEPGEPINTGDTTAEVTKSGDGEIKIDMRPHMPVMARTSSLNWSAKGTQVGGNVRVSIMQSRTEGSLVIARSSSYNCAVAYVVDEDNTAESLLKRHAAQDATVVKVVDGMVDIPEKIAVACFDKSLSMRVFDMDDKIEFWSDANWKSFENTHSASMLLDPLRATPSQKMVCLASMLVDRCRG